MKGQRTTMSSEAGRPVINITGDRVAVGPWRHDLAETYLHWFNDMAVARTLNHPRQVTMVELRSSMVEQESDSSVQGFTIYETDGLRPIGNAALTNIDFRDRTCDFEIVIGEASARGKGYGTEATRLVLDHAFTVLGMRNVMLKVYAFNLAGIKAYENAGFRQFGRRRQAAEMNGEPWDVIYMESLRDDFESPVLGAVFTPDQPR
jgi:diamine N-acetyltransferase